LLQLLLRFLILGLLSADLTLLVVGVVGLAWLVDKVPGIGTTTPRLPNDSMLEPSKGRVRRCGGVIVG